MVRADDATPDRELAGHVIEKRDADAFRTLYGRHTPSLYAMAMRMTGDPAVAEDAVHDAWVRAIESLPRFEWRSTLRTWLTSILLNRLHEVRRRERPTVELDESHASSGETPELPHGIEPLDLERAIAALPAGYRRVLVLHDVEGFTHEDIASFLGIDRGTSKSQLSRARRQLRRALSKDEEETS